MLVVYSPRNSQTQSFKSELLPSLPLPYKLGEKVDNMVALRLYRSRLLGVVNTMAAQPACLHLGLTTDGHLRDVPLFRGIEVKKGGSDIDEAKLQLDEVMRDDTASVLRLT